MIPFVKATLDKTKIGICIKNVELVFERNKERMEINDILQTMGRRCAG